ncbi:MAG: hypothetical protein M3Y20_00465 [Actinomycetota bacterium]|nr:hypothetical protein [Actinomycetota bacterium]
MPRTLTRPTAALASLALGLTGLVAAGGALAPAAAATSDPLRTATIETGAALATPAAVKAGTLVFIKAHNVWMSRSDGSGQVQVTKDATSAYSAYSSPRMSDDGIITALQGTDVIRMRTDGTVLSSWDAGTLVPAPDGGIQSTTSVVVSPDGSKVAYDQTSWKGFGYDVSVGTRFSASSHYSSAGAQELFRSGPSWVSNSRVLLRAWGSIYLRDIASATSVEWFTDEDVIPIPPDCDFLCWGQEQWSPELSRDGSRLVTMRGPTDDPTLIIYSVTGNPKTSIPPAPALGCTFGGAEPDDEFDHPTIGPDNRSLAWEMAAGIFVKGNLDDCGTSDVALAIPGGSEPSWGAPAYTAPPAPKPDPQPGDKISVTKAPVVTGTAKVGKSLKATKGSWKPAPSKFAYQWKRNGKAIKKATKSTYKLTKSDAGKKITVTVTATRASFKKASATSKAVGVAAHNTKKPAIKKKPAARVGKTLKVTKGTWLGKPKLSYQWYRGSKKIKGATKSKYKVTKADRGKKLRVKVTAKRSGAPKTSVWTAKTKKVR